MKKLTKTIELIRNLKKSEEQIKKLQLKKLKKIIKYSYENVPFYQKKFNSVNIKPEDIQTFEDLKKIPTTTKEELRNAKEKILAKGFNENNCKKSKSSGSTGEPFTSYFDKNSWFILKNITKLRARFLCGLKFGNKAVNIECYPKEKINQLNKTSWLKDRILKLRYISLYDSLENHIKYFNKFKPHALYGFPSYFIELGEHLQKTKTKLPYIKTIFTSGELLDTPTKNKLKKHFGENIYDIYGSTETLEISWECKQHKGYHINEDLCYIEFNKQKKDQDAEILITTLENLAMPLIRYNIGDRGEKIKEKCPCGLNFTLMKPSMGRNVDYIQLKNGKKISPYVLTMALENIQEISQYQITQKTLEEIEIKIKTNTKLTEQTKKQIKTNIEKILGKNMKIKIIECNKIPREKNGKYRVVRGLGR